MSNRNDRRDLARRLQVLERRVSVIEEGIKPGSVAPAVSSQTAARNIRFAELPNSLAKSLQAMQQLGEADATTVSRKTERNRSVETIYLNQLVRLGYLTRRRVGKKVFFRLAKVY